MYPGVATTPSSPDSDIDEKYVNVEFDDGDNGRIVLDHIRFLLSDYPVVGKLQKPFKPMQNFTQALATEYDPNPLQSLNKRKRPLSQGVPSDHEKPSTSVVDTSSKSKERKRLKKMRKDKLRLQSSPDHAQDSFAANSTLEKKHKKKHKCQDDLCKHRKHKKRRKHKKHHHRELDEEDRDLQHHVQSAMSISNDSNNNEEEFDEDSLSVNESVTQYEIVKKVDQEMVIKDDPDTMESSITESSGSVYVSSSVKEILNGFLLKFLQTATEKVSVE